jgi:hypothetical protein
MPQNATRLISRRLLQDCVYVPAEIWQKTTPLLTPAPPLPNKNDQIKNTSM